LVTCQVGLQLLSTCEQTGDEWKAAVDLNPASHNPIMMDLQTIGVNSPAAHLRYQAAAPARNRFKGHQPLVPGSRLGSYEILTAIGADGMGVVYCALDTRMQRTVAIKILLAQLSSDPDLYARFLPEAKCISAVQHPNICVVYEIGSQDGIDSW
jgi:serine/threonine protein kinase